MMKRCNTLNKKKQECILLSILGMTLLLMVLFHVYYLTGIQHAYDESGYWSAAAYLLGFDWSDLSEYNLYYSYGYGFLLAVIMKFFSQKYIYIFAVVLNAILLLLEMLVVNYCLKRLATRLSMEFRVAISFVVIIYPYNIFYAHLTVSEVLLSFLFVISIAVIIKMLDTEKCYWSAVFAVLIGFMYMVHQRSIGIIISAVMMLVCTACMKKKKFYNLIIFVVTLLVIMILGQMIKHGYVKAWFSNNSQAAELNDYSGQTSKIAFLFSGNGVISLLYSVIGKWFGICSSTCLFVSYGLFGILKDIFVGFKNRSKISTVFFVEIYCLLSFLAVFGVSCIFFIQPEGYADYLVYTRYMEMTIIPILFYGIYRVLQKDVIIKEMVANVIILSIFAAMVANRAAAVGLTDYVGQANVAIWDMYKDGMSVTSFLGQVCIRTIFVAIIVQILSVWNRKFILLILSCLWIGISISAYEKDYSARNANDIKDISMAILEEGEMDTLYYYVGKEENATVTAFYLQLMEPERKITVLKTWDEVTEVPKGSYILINGTDDIVFNDFSDYNIIKSSKRYKLMKRIN